MRKKGLVIDDSPLVRELCRMALQGQVREIIPAGSGCEAFDMLRKHPDTDLILLDIHMPAMHGLAVLAAIRETGSYRNVPVILLSQRGDEGDVERGLSLGAAGAVQKFEDLRGVLPGLVRRLRSSPMPAVGCRAVRADR
jgi:CheY-like chemotaxis protein